MGKLQETLLSQRSDFEEHGETLANQEASHQASVAANSLLRQQRGEQEAKDRKTLAESLQKQKDDACAELRQELALQKTHFQERNQVLEAKCSELEKQLESTKDSAEEAQSLVGANKKAREEAEKARESTEKERGDRRVELNRLEAWYARLE